ncbi:hypothetical protein KBI33_01205 [Candidatus Shapirobacteria bacterium]|nr:hypothetical protein [Candidatus Shapirobacteria bacterium]
MKPKLLVPLFFLLLAGIGTWLVVGKGKEFTPTVSEEDEDETQLLKRINSTPTPLPENTPTTETPTSAASTVPLPTEEDIVRLFFNLIDEERIPEAVAMMSVEAVPDDSYRQAWGVQFNALDSIKVSKIEPYDQGNWSPSSHTYKVNLEVAVSENAANAPIPYYGWENGDNLRWVEIVKEGDLWKINQIATGA